MLVCLMPVFLFLEQNVMHMTMDKKLKSLNIFIIENVTKLCTQQGPVTSKSNHSV